MVTVFPGAITVTCLNGFFVFNESIASSNIWCSQKDNGLVYDALDFEVANSSPDGVISVASDHGELWVFGTSSTEVWYYAANPIGFPFSRIPAAVNEVGSAAPYASAKLDNTLFWLSSNNRGNGMVYRANGYVGERVSTHAVEWQIQQYGDISNALAYTYQQDGHGFYVLVFPSENTTWVYDVATQSWHERCGFVDGEFTRHRGNCQMFWNNLTIIGDYDNGNVYSFDLTVYADDGEIQKWLRSWRALPTGQNDLKRTAHHSLQLDIEAGVGNEGDGDPEVMMRFSDDGGHTWSNEAWRTLGIGSLGEYGKRVIWRRLGMTTKLRDRVYEVSGTDPVKIAIMGAELVMSPTNA